MRFQAAHPGKWRDQAKTSQYCSTKSKPEGPVCTHGSIIQDSHYSCCGQSDRYSAACCGPSSSSDQRSSAEESFVVGCRVQLAPGYASHSDAAGGPLTPGDIGTLIEDDKSSKPYKVEYGGKTYWYEKPALVVAGSASSKPSKLCPNGHGLEPFVYTRSHTCDSCRTSIIVGQTGRRCQSCDHDLCPSCCRARFNDVEKGSRVVISSTCTDHALLQPGQVGLVVEDDGSGTPFKVSFEGKTRWYKRSELALADTASVAEKTTSRWQHVYSIFAAFCF